MTLMTTCSCGNEDGCVGIDNGCLCFCHHNEFAVRWAKAEKEKRDALLQNREAMEALRYAGVAMAKAWAALGDNLESQAHGGNGIDRLYAHTIQSELQVAQDRVQKALKDHQADKRKCVDVGKHTNPGMKDGKLICYDCGLSPLSAPGPTVTMAGCGHTVKVTDVLCPMCGV